MKHFLNSSNKWKKRRHLMKISRWRRTLKRSVAHSRIKTMKPKRQYRSWDKRLRNDETTQTQLNWCQTKNKVNLNCTKEYLQIKKKSLSPQNKLTQLLTKANSSRKQPKNKASGGPSSRIAAWWSQVSASLLQATPKIIRFLHGIKLQFVIKFHREIKMFLGHNQILKKKIW